MSADNTSVIHHRPTIKLDSALAVIRLAFQAARQDPHSSDAIACAVSGSNGELVAFAAHDDCGPLPRSLALRKAYTAVVLKRNTSEVKAAVGEGRIDLARIGDDDLVPMPGGAPVFVDGVIIGAIGISGLPPEDDARIAEETLRSFAQV